MILFDSEFHGCPSGKELDTIYDHYEQYYGNGTYGQYQYYRTYGQYSRWIYLLEDWYDFI